jgi:hypothetical protein
MSSEIQIGDLLRGAEAIADYLNQLSSKEDDWNTEDVYYAHRAKKLPIGKYGKELIASKAKLAKHVGGLV